MKFTISAPGKIILMGEHAVVYGKPAIVAAVDKRMTVNLVGKNGKWEITAKSDIPIGCGLGSSAALAVIQATALVAIQATTVGRIDTKLPLINEVAYEIEKINHGHPSGVDNTICTYGGILWFKRKGDGPPIFKRLQLKNLPELVLINTGKAKETTREMVENVKCQMLNGKTKWEILKLFDQIEKQTNNFLKALRQNNSQLLKSSFRICERNLEKLGVVGELAKNIVRKIEKRGGVAKISGAGGLTGGSGMLLCYHPNPQQIIDLAKKLRLESFRVKLGEEGLRIDE
ncbi:hypothetical protein HZB97_00610 [Candidatus Gottesmanbacteria bacterium]|nr:hypothetical protein [Candidatus Gottesmanbacteria bacterium]